MSSACEIYACLPTCSRMQCPTYRCIARQTCLACYVAKDSSKDFELPAALRGVKVIWAPTIWSSYSLLLPFSSSISQTWVGKTGNESSLPSRRSHVTDMMTFGKSSAVACMESRKLQRSFQPCGRAPSGKPTSGNTAVTATLSSALTAIVAAIDSERSIWRITQREAAQLSSKKLTEQSCRR